MSMLYLYIAVTLTRKEIKIDSPRDATRQMKCHNLTFNRRERGLIFPTPGELRKYETALKRALFRAFLSLPSSPFLFLLS